MCNSRIVLPCIIALLLITFGGRLDAQNSPLTTLSDMPGLLQHVDDAASDSVKLDRYSRIIAFYNSQDNDSAVLYARRGLAIFKDKNYKRGQARMILSLADFDDTHGAAASAMEKTEYAINLFRQADFRPGLADALNVMGILEAKKGNYDKAMFDFSEAQNIYTQFDAKKGLVTVLLNLGLLSDVMHDSIKLFLYYRKADSISRLMPLSDNVIDLYNNLGVSYIEHGDTARGYSYLQKALELSDRPEYTLTHIVVTITLGELMLNSGKKAEGIVFLQKGLALAQQHHLPDQEAGILDNLAAHTENADTAAAYLDTAVSLLLQTGNKNRLLELYGSCAHFYEEKNNYEKQARYLKLQKALSDSLYNINKAKEIANVAAVYDLQAYNSRINDLEALVRSNSLQKNIIVGILVLLVLSEVILFYYYRKTKKLNHSLEEGKKELAQLNSMKDKLFSIIGHDLRGPVANIPAVISILEEELPVNNEFREALDIIKDQAYSTVETLDKLLVLGKAMVKGQPATHEIFAPKQLTEKNIAFLSLTAANKNIRIEDSTNADLFLYGNPGHFDFVIRNLLSNAIKFSFPGGKIEVSSEYEAATGFVKFCVRDYGSGIPADMLPHLFKSTITSTYGTANEKGTGIGLMLCNEFVALDGGNMSVVSEPGKGSSFFFTLKRA